MSAQPSPDEIASRASVKAFGSPLVTNNLRGLIVEAVVDAALSPSWSWDSADWASWDFTHADGTRLEVKQSAIRQTWSQKTFSSPRFDIAARTGRYEGVEWLAEAGRSAQIYVLAVHTRTDDEADHRDPSQWFFYIIESQFLPHQKTIGISTVSSLAKVIEWQNLFVEVESVRTNRVRAGS